MRTSSRPVHYLTTPYIIQQLYTRPKHKRINVFLAFLWDEHMKVSYINYHFKIYRALFYTINHLNEGKTLCIGMFIDVLQRFVYQYHTMYAYCVLYEYVIHNKTLYIYIIQLYTQIQ